MNLLNLYNVEVQVFIFPSFSIQRMTQVLKLSIEWACIFSALKEEK